MDKSVDIPGAPEFYCQPISREEMVAKATLMLNKERNMFDQITIIKFKGKSYEQQHGNPFDRGSADSYYGRPRSPHKYPNGTGNAPRVEELTQAEREQYLAGYEYNEACGDKKSYD